jgi:hypothetical protein
LSAAMFVDESLFARLLVVIASGWRTQSECAV